MAPTRSAERLGLDAVETEHFVAAYWWRWNKVLLAANLAAYVFALGLLIRRFLLA